MAIIILLAITALYTITGEFAEQSDKLEMLGEPEEREERSREKGRNENLKGGYLQWSLKDRGGEKREKKAKKEHLPRANLFVLAFLCHQVALQL